MLEYAQDAQTHEEPWLLWEYNPEDTRWWSLHTHPVWEENNRYRRKLQTININGIRFTKPESKPLEAGQVIYIVSLLHSSLYMCCAWENTDRQNQVLSLGLVHKTPEAAKQHAEALLSFTRGK